ncbi:hypothetical protein H5U35_05240 [Candidatus Aerophobetes bacterium]|nr:hypothetical protein [Candidatus Aerophobetes bacterium]
MKTDKIMIAVGLILLFLWCLCGFYLGVLHEPYLSEMKSLAEEGNLTGFWETFSSWKIKSSAHAHALCLSFLLILVGLSMPHIRFGNTLKLVFGTVLIVGVVISPISQWFEIKPGMIIGDILIVAMLLASFIGVLRMLWAKKV